MPEPTVAPAVARRRRPVLRVLVWALVVVLAVALELAIRAGEPKPVGPSGVDELTVPRTQIDPDDFVATVDHPWWPVTAGHAWTFDGGARWVASEGPRVAGVATTTLSLDAVGRRRSLDLAQDVDGNVWVMAERDTTDVERSWSVADGEGAGLLLPAVPRRGDGYALSAPGGTVTERVETGEEEPDAISTRAGRFAPTLEVTLVSVPRASGSYGTTLRLSLARGVGPVRMSSIADGVQRLEAQPSD